MNLNRRTVPDYPNYEISDCGRIFKKEGMVRWGAMADRWMPEKELSPRLDKYGYLRIHLTNDEARKFIPIHRLVAMAFVDGRSDDKDVINHIDGIKTNNHYSNLEWTTVLENNRHKWEMKKTDRGLIYSDQTIEDVLKFVRDNHKNISNLKIVSEKFNVPIHTVRQILKGFSHKSVYENMGGFEVFSKIYSEIKNNTVPEPRTLPFKYEIEGKLFRTHGEIAIQYGVSIDTINNRLNSESKKFENWRRV